MSYQFAVTGSFDSETRASFRIVGGESYDIVFWLRSFPENTMESKAIARSMSPEGRLLHLCGEGFLQTACHKDSHLVASQSCRRPRCRRKVKRQMLWRRPAQGDPSVSLGLGAIQRSRNYVKTIGFLIVTT